MLTYWTMALISYAGDKKWKVTLKILQGSIQEYVNRELPHVQAGFRNVREMRAPNPIADIGRNTKLHWITLKHLCGSQQDVENS